MGAISDRIFGRYQVRREVSKPADLATLLLADLIYEQPARLPAEVNDLILRFLGAR